MTEVPIDEAQSRLRALAQEAAEHRHRVTLTDQGRPVAVLLGLQELEDPEDAAILADYRTREASGALAFIAHEEVRGRLGLERR